jgi:hypothetical protein
MPLHATGVLRTGDVTVKDCFAHISSVLDSTCWQWYSWTLRLYVNVESTASSVDIKVGNSLPFNATLPDATPWRLSEPHSSPLGITTCGRIEDRAKRRYFLLLLIVIQL